MNTNKQVLKKLDSKQKNNLSLQVTRQTLIHANPPSVGPVLSQFASIRNQILISIKCC